MPAPNPHLIDSSNKPLSPPPQSFGEFGSRELPIRRVPALPYREARSPSTVQPPWSTQNHPAGATLPLNLSYGMNGGAVPPSELRPHAESYQSTGNDRSNPNTVDLHGSGADVTGMNSSSIVGLSVSSTHRDSGEPCAVVDVRPVSAIKVEQISLDLGRFNELLASVANLKLCQAMFERWSLQTDS